MWPSLPQARAEVSMQLCSCRRKLHQIHALLRKVTVLQRTQVMRKAFLKHRSLIYLEVGGGGSKPGHHFVLALHGPARRQEVPLAKLWRGMCQPMKFFNHVTSVASVNTCLQSRLRSLEQGIRRHHTTWSCLQHLQDGCH